MEVFVGKNRSVNVRLTFTYRTKLPRGAFDTKFYLADRDMLITESSKHRIKKQEKRVNIAKQVDKFR